MFSRRSKWILGGSLAILVAGMSVSVLASGTQGNWKEKAGKELGERLAAKAGLKGEKVGAFVKVWEASSKERKARRKQTREAMDGLVAAVQAGKTGKDLSRSLDGVQAAFLSEVDGAGRTISSLREVLSAEEQARVLLGQKGYKILSLPGMKQAVPALVGYIRSELLASVSGLDPAARKKLDEIGDASMQQRVKLYEQRIEAIKRLEAASSSGKIDAALLDQIAANGAALRETVAEEATEIRKSVPDAELAKVLAAIKEKAKSLKHKLGGVLKEAVTAQ